MRRNNKRAILCVDDEMIVTEALRFTLRRQLSDMAIEVANSADEALEIIAELSADGIELCVVIADYIMPGMKGDALLAEIHRQAPRAKKIMLTGQSDIEGIKRAINEADLYRFLEKPWNNEDLLLTLKGAIGSFWNEKELEWQYIELKRLNSELEAKVNERTRELSEKNRELERLSTTDRLTNLYNRLKLEEIFRAELERAELDGGGFGVIMLDVDGFKSVNDAYGHQVGDQVLVELAGLLKRHCRASDAVGRWGGEEFLLICPQTTADSLLGLAELLRQTIEQWGFTVVGQRTASLGITCYQPGDSSNELIARADAALYRAKALGRNRIEQHCEGLLAS